MDNYQTEILQDIDRLKISYKVKLFSAARKDWQPYFHELSLDSHHNNQLFLDRNQLFSGERTSATLSGLALHKDIPVKKINLIGNNHCFSATTSVSSPAVGKRLPDIKNSSNCRWKCNIILNRASVQNFDLVITLENNLEIIYKKIEFRLVKLSSLVAEIDHKANQELVNKINSIDRSRRLMNQRLYSNKNYLFAIGNARSGTTALGKLLNYSSKICLGIERYSNNDNISALSFTKEAFFDTKSKNYLIRPHFYEKIGDKFEQAKYVGDKRPRFVQSWRNTWLNLPQAKIVYIFRNIYDVACSYNNRADRAALGIDTSWSSERDFSKAVQDWNEGLAEVENLIEFFEVYLVKYEDLFIDRAKMRHLLNFLGVDLEEENIQAGMTKIYQKALSLQQKERTLSDAEINYINTHANFSAYNNLLTLYTRQDFA